MFFDLETQELMHRFECFWIPRPNPYQATVPSFFVLVSDVRLLLLHHLCSIRHLTVHKHRDLKIPMLEHLGDMTQVLTPVAIRLPWRTLDNALRFIVTEGICAHSRLWCQRAGS